MAVAVLCVAAVAYGAVPAEKPSPFKGEVVSVDTKAKTVTVKAITTTTMSTTIVKGEMTFATDKKTKISEGKKSQALKKLKTGDMVEVQYHSKGGKDIKTCAFLVHFLEEVALFSPPPPKCSYRVRFRLSIPE